MKVTIAYESKYGNGKKCMEFLKEALSKEGHTVDLFSVRDKKPSGIGEADLYVFSAPTQIGNAAGKMRKFIRKAEFPTQGAKYALVTTCMDPKKLKSLHTMEGLLSPKGLQKAADGLVIKVTGMKGPCEEDHEARLADFAKKVTA